MHWGVRRAWGQTNGCVIKLHTNITFSSPIAGPVVVAELVTGGDVRPAEFGAETLAAPSSATVCFAIKGGAISAGESEVFGEAFATHTRRVGGTWSSIRDGVDEGRDFLTPR